MAPAPVTLTAYRRPMLVWVGSRDFVVLGGDRARREKVTVPSEVKAQFGERVHGPWSSPLTPIRRPLLLHEVRWA